MIKNNPALKVMIAFLLLMPAALASQEKNADSYPDIGVMNSILGQLLKGIDGENYGRPQVSGSYLPGYGLLFLVNQSDRMFGSGLLAGRLGRETDIIDLTELDSSMAVFDSAMKEYEISMMKLDSGTTSRDSVIVRSRPNVRWAHPPKIEILKRAETMSAQASKEMIGKLDKQVVKFLASYADAENKLTPAQHISVIFLMGGDSMQARYYTVSKKEVSAYRAQSETQAAFGQKVQISDLKGHDDSIDIMETILDKSIDDRTPGDHRYLFGANSRGIYLKGLGAFFVCRLTDVPDFIELGDRPRPKKDKTPELEKLVVKALGNYGSSLRFLTEGESILVSVQFNSFGSGDRGILISLKKKDIDAYSRNEISYDALRQRATIIENQ